MIDAEIRYGSMFRHFYLKSVAYCVAVKKRFTMAISLWNILIPATAGIIGVMIGSMKPLIDWSIERKRLRREERKLFIKDIRNFVSQKDFNINAEFLRTAAYSRLRPHLSKDFLSFFEDGKVSEKLSSRHLFHTPWLLDEIQKLERKWGLL